jgi:hypothetical protein
MNTATQQKISVQHGFAQADLVNGLILLAIPCALFLPTVLRNQIPYFMDIVAQFYPVKMFAAHLFHQRELPLWNPTYYCGVPFLANPQWGILYPGNALFFLIPSGWSFTATLVLHSVIGSWGLYLLARHITQNRYAAMLAALLYLLGGYTWAHYAFGAFLLTLAWVPFVYFWFERYMETQRSVYVLAAGAGLALQILSGTPQLTYYSVLSYLVLVVVRGVGEWRGGEGVKGLRQPAIFFLGMSVIGLGLSAPQWLASLRFIAECKRSAGLSMAEVKTGTLSLGQLWCAFTGGTGFPEDAETTAYIGLFPLFLAIFGALGCSRRGLGAYRIIALGSILLMLSALAPFFYHWFPLYRHFHDPKRILGILMIVVSLLAACGLCRVWALFSRGWQKDRFWAYVGGALLVVLFILEAAWTRGVFGPPGFELGYRLLGWITMSSELTIILLQIEMVLFILAVVMLLIWRLALLRLVSPAFPLFLMVFCFVAFGFLCPHLEIIKLLNLVVLAGSSTLLLMLWIRRPENPLPAVLVLILVALSTTVFSFGMIDLKFIGAQDLFQHTSLSEPMFGSDTQSRFLSYDDGIHYSYDYTRAGFGERLLPNVGSYYGLEDFQGYDPSIPRRYAAYLDLINRGFVRLYPTHFGIVRNLGSPLLDRANVRYLIGDAESYVPFMQSTSVYQGEPLTVRLEMHGPFSAITLWAHQEPFLYIPNGEEVGSISLYANGNMVERFPLRFGVNVGGGSMRYSRAEELINQQETQFCDFIRERGTPFFATRFPLSTPKSLSRILLDWTWGRGSLLLVKQVTLQPVAWGEAVKLVREQRGKARWDSWRLRLYERKGVLPRAQMATQVVQAASPEEATLKLAALDAGQDSTVIVETEARDGALPSQPGNGNVLQATYKTNQVELKVECDEPGGFVVFRDAFFPGWRATIDNEPAKIYPTDLMFRGIMIPKGVHSVRFVYRPLEVVYGFVLVLVTLASVVVYLLLARRTRRHLSEADSEVIS